MTLEEQLDRAREQLRQTRVELREARRLLARAVSDRQTAEARIGVAARRTKLSLEDGAVVTISGAEADAARELMHFVRGKRLTPEEPRLRAALRLLRAAGRSQ